MIDIVSTLSDTQFLQLVQTTIQQLPTTISTGSDLEIAVIIGMHEG